MSNLKNLFSNLLKRFRFTQGLALGLTISSFFAYGVVSIIQFSPNTVISAADVNSNFHSLKTAVDSLQESFIGEFGSNPSIPCVVSVSIPSYPNDFHNLHSYTIPATGAYQVHYDLPEIASVVSRIFTVNGVKSDIPAKGSIVRKLNSGDLVTFEAGCTHWTTGSFLLDMNGMVVIKKF